MTNAIKISGEKLERAFTSRKIKFKDASVEMGFASSYLSNCKSREIVPEYAIKLLKSLYGIEREELLPDKEPETDNCERTEFDYDKLYQTIYAAVYAATKIAVEESWKNI